ncbi:MAG: putative 4-hydroxybenzoate polyprenyltransferase [Bacteroidales bacterium]|nr:putative 4-hydroxybenzoate polyprenyltransferase [Bacteroidales bacterium]
MVKTIRNYLSLVKFSHTVFALPFAVIGFFLVYRQTPQNVDVWLFVLVLLCMVFARNAAMSFNRLVDRRFDAINPRTQNREIPRGIITSRATAVFVTVNVLLFIATTYFINRTVFFLSPIALAIVLLYSYTKRFTMFCHFVLGLGLALAPIGAYLSVTSRFELLPLLYSVIVLFWVSGFDIMYALQDEDFDKRENLKSLPAALGVKKSLLVANLLHFVAGAVVVLIGILYHSDVWYWVGAALFIALLIYQHLIVKPTDISRVNMAFATTNGLASIIYATFNVISIFF